MALTQAEFDYIIGLEKSFKENEDIVVGPPPLKWSREIISNSTKDFFTLDFYRGSIEIRKYTYNKRFRNAIVLLRYDAMGRHTNPPEADGASFDGAHVHLYREGFDDRWAFPVTQIGLSGTETIDEVLTGVLQFCHVISVPTVKLSLF